MKALASVALLALGACTTDPKPPFEPAVVSMTTEKAPPQCLSPGGVIREQWCEDEALQVGSKDQFGFFDQVIHKAQMRHKVDYLLNNKLTVRKDKDGRTCAHLTAALPVPCRDGMK